MTRLEQHLLYIIMLIQDCLLLSCYIEDTTSSGSKQILPEIVMGDNLHELL